MVEHARFLFTNTVFPVRSLTVQITVTGSEQDMELQNYLNHSVYSLQTGFPTCGVTNHATQHIEIYVNIVFSSQPNAIARIRGPQSLNEEQETSAFSNLFICPATDKVNASL